MDPYMLERCMEKNKWRFGKSKKEAYSPDIDLWSIGCTLVFIACNTYAFNAATPEGLMEVYQMRDLKHIMGAKVGDEIPDFLETFRPVSPISTTASCKLQEMYINVIRECFKPLEERSYNSILQQIDVLKKKGLCYMIDINQGFGQYEINEMKSNDSKNVVFKREYIDHYSKGLKFPVVVRFSLELGQPAATKTCDLYEMPSDPVGKGKTVVKSQCSAIRTIYSQAERPNFDISMLKLLCLVECSDEKYKRIQEDCLVEYNKEMNEIETRYLEISRIYKDVQEIDRKIDLLPLQKKCGNIEIELKSNLRKYARVVYGKRDSIGLIEKLANLIVEEIKLGKNPKN